MKLKFFLLIVWAFLFLNTVQIFSSSFQSAKQEKEKQRIIYLENKWLNNLHNADLLNSVLANDFVHPV